MGDYNKALFLPGASGSADLWRPIGKRLDLDPVYLAWPGLGEQPADPSITCLDDLVRLVEAQAGERPVDLLAQSMGGVVALKVVLRGRVRVRRMVLSVTSGGVDAAVRAAALHDWRANYRVRFPRAATWIADDRTDLTERLREVTCPTLLLFGDADPIAPPVVGKRVASLLPNARLHVVAGGNHDLVSTRADDVLPIIASHLAG